MRERCALRSRECQPRAGVGKGKGKGKGKEKVREGREGGGK